MVDVSILLQQVTAAMAPPRHATYRLQLGAALGFEGVADLAPYLSALGVSDAYLSPCFKCGPGSSHGYDVTDHNAFNPDVGSAATFDRMAAALAARGLGIVLDIVPNHMGIPGDANPWWLDVLENGPSSPRAAFFDIDWAPVKPELRNTVLLPILPDQYGRVLEAQQLEIELSEGAFFVRHAGARLPLCPDSYPQILTHRLETLAERLDGEHAGLGELRSILTTLEHLPGRIETDPAKILERLRETAIIKRRLAALVKDSTEIRALIDDNVRIFNGVPGEPASFDLLDRLLSAQTYRRADWRVAGDEVNYRRFFDVSNLAALRMEIPEVFAASHELTLRLVGEGKVTGLRVDHPDGLYAPGEYFRRLQEGAVLVTARRLIPELGASDLEALAAHYRTQASTRPGAAEARPLWIAAEKILMPGEPLPDWWVVAGTTGYDFLGSVNGLFADRGTSRRMTAIYQRFAGVETPMADLSYAAKRLIMQVSMASEINQLGQHLDRISEQNRLFRDFTLLSLVRVLRVVIAAFPVYRTYVGDDGSEPSPCDRGYIRQAMLDDLRRRIAEAPDDLTALCAELLESWPVGMVKLYLTHRALTLRRAHPRLFGLGAYLPLAAAGERAEHVVSLARQDGPDVAVVAVPRLAAHLTGFTGRWPLGPDVWGTTRLSLGDPGLAGVYRDRFSGLRLVTESQDGAPALPAMALFAAFPVALLEREEARHER